MSRPHEPDKVKLICSLFSPEKELVETTIRHLEDLHGKADWVSDPLFFDRTQYYAGEMGWPLHRRFVSFGPLIAPDDLVAVKIRTNEIEQACLVEGNRRINIDPGYISPERLVLATGKNFTHRIYLARGIYADLTLIFQKGSFRKLEWTFPDYADPQIIGWLNKVRVNYMKQLKGG